MSLSCSASEAEAENASESDMTFLAFEPDGRVTGLTVARKGSGAVSEWRAQWRRVRAGLTIF